MKTSLEIRDEILSLVREYYNVSYEERKPRDKLPYSGRVYDDDELVSLVDSSLEFFLTAGRYTDAFEKSFSSFLGISHSHFVNSGSSANLLAISALTSPELKERRLMPGDEVLTVAAGFPTTVAPIIQNGLVPVFVDIEPVTVNIDADLMEYALSRKTKAIMLAHTLGNPFDLERVRALCDTYNLWLIEDNCDALGSKYNGKYTGTLGDISTCSFYPPHMITTGEGGMVSTNSSVLSKIVQSMRDWGRACVCKPGQDNRCNSRFKGQYGDLPEGYDHKYVYSHLGYNLKATDMQAAIGLEQLKKLSYFSEARRRNHALLSDGLKDIDRIFVVKPTRNSDPNWFGLLMLFPSNGIRDGMAKHLEDSGIQTRMLFAGNLVKQPCMNHLVAGYHYRVDGNLDMTDMVMERGLWVGVYPGLSSSDIDRMISTIRSYFV